MKSAGFLILTIILASQSSFAARIGQLQVKSCVLLTPRETDEKLLSLLMKKGFAPVNSVDKDAYSVSTGIHGSLNTKIAQKLRNDKDSQGMPYLEINHQLTMGYRIVNLGLGVIDPKDSRGYVSSHGTALDSEDEIYSMTNIPNCTED